jgi:hypothetical protein
MSLSWNPNFYTEFFTTGSASVPVPSGDEPWIFLVIFGANDNIVDGMTMVSGSAGLWKGLRSELGSSINLTIGSSSYDEAVVAVCQLPGEPGDYTQGDVVVSPPETIEDASVFPTVIIATATTDVQGLLPFISYAGDDFSETHLYLEVGGDVVFEADIAASDSPGPFTIDSIADVEVFWLYIPLTIEPQTSSGGFWSFG